MSENQAIAGAESQREQSTIQFPYGDLSDAISVAQGIIKCGGRPTAPDQLAAAMGHAPTSGGFKTKIASARTFGAIETVRGQYHLTDLGFGLTDRNLEKRSRADAFLNRPMRAALGLAPARLRADELMPLRVATATSDSYGEEFYAHDGGFFERAGLRPDLGDGLGAAV